MLPPFKAKQCLNLSSSTRLKLPNRLYRRINRINCGVTRTTIAIPDARAEKLPQAVGDTRKHVRASTDSIVFLRAKLWATICYQNSVAIRVRLVRTSTMPDTTVGGNSAPRRALGSNYIDVGAKHFVWMAPSKMAARDEANAAVFSAERVGAYKTVIISVVPPLQIRSAVLERETPLFFGHCLFPRPNAAALN